MVSPPRSRRRGSCHYPMNPGKAGSHCQDLNSALAVTIGQCLLVELWACARSTFFPHRSVGGSPGYIHPNPHPLALTNLKTDQKPEWSGSHGMQSTPTASRSVMERDSGSEGANSVWSAKCCQKHFRAQRRAVP